MARASIAGTGSYLPKRVLTNFDLERMVDTSDEWITQRTGIKRRHLVSDSEAASDIAVSAARPAMEEAGVTAGDIDAVIAATITPDTSFPSTACWIQKALRLPPGIPAFDISAACSGFLYGLVVADSLIQTGVCNTVLLAATEVLSRITNWEDRSTCVLFGDGAGAVILKKAEGEESGLVSSCWSADGNLGDLLILPAGGSRLPASGETVEKKLHTIRMNGNEVFKHAVRAMGTAAETALEKAGLKAEDVDLFIPHQANVRIINATCKRTGIPTERTVTVIDRIGNVSAATIPIALDIANKERNIEPGNVILFAAFGGGFTWGAGVVRW